MQQQKPKHRGSETKRAAAREKKGRGKEKHFKKRNERPKTIHTKAHHGKKKTGPKLGIEQDNRTITEDDSKQDQILLVKIDEYVGFCVHRRSYLLGSPVTENETGNVNNRHKKETRHRQENRNPKRSGKRKWNKKHETGTGNKNEPEKVTCAKSENIKRKATNENVYLVLSKTHANQYKKNTKHEQEREIKRRKNKNMAYAYACYITTQPKENKKILNKKLRNSKSSIKGELTKIRTIPKGITRPRGWGK